METAELEQPGTELEPTPDAGGRGVEEGLADETGQDTSTTEAAPLDADTIADKIAERWAKANPTPTQQQQEKQYTPEELDELFNVYKPANVDDLMSAFREGDAEAFTKAVLELRDGVFKQAMTAANYTIEAKLKELDGRYAPFAKEAETAAAQKAEAVFFAESKDLVPHKKLVNMVFNQMIQSGKRFPDAKSASKAVADETRALLKEMGVSTGTNNGSGTSQTKMQPLSRGGTGGSRPSGQSAPTGVAASLRELS